MNSFWDNPPPMFWACLSIAGFVLMVANAVGAVVWAHRNEPWLVWTAHVGITGSFIAFIGGIVSANTQRK